MSYPLHWKSHGVGHSLSTSIHLFADKADWFICPPSSNEITVNTFLKPTFLFSIAASSQRWLLHLSFKLIYWVVRNRTRWQNVIPVALERFHWFLAAYPERCTSLHSNAYPPKFSPLVKVFLLLTPKTQDSDDQNATLEASKHHWEISLWLHPLVEGLT